MDLDEEILSDFSDSEIVESKHKSLVDTISSLDKKARLKPASRKEPSLQISEYHLVNKGDGEKEQKKLVDIKSLVKSLKKKPSNNHIAKKIAAVHDSSKNLTLPKPLEKIYSDKIEREVAYKNVKEDISKWDPIVFDNRTADQIKFPLKQIDVDAVEDELKQEKSHHNFLNTFKKPTHLELALANLLDSSQVVTQYREEKERREQELRDRRAENKNAEFKLTLQEMKEKQKEFSKLRAQKAFKEKKAWMQNKIKSKKYHRLMKREKVKEKLKEFERLQRSDPQAALAQLELLDRTRAEERITLRHKSTGQWAKNLQVRAKYDRESRIALAEQLSQSRALSLKVKRADSSEEEEEEEEDSGVEPDETNPWMKPEAEDVGSYFSGYRKYWQEKEEQEKDGGDEVSDARSSEYGAVSLEKLAETFDDMDEDLDMPVFLEAASGQPGVTSCGEEENETDLNQTSESKGKERKRRQNHAEENEQVPESNETLEEKRDEPFEGKVTESKRNTRKRKSREPQVENIMDRSGQWTVIPVENVEEESIVNGKDKILSTKKCDSNGFDSVSKSVASPKDKIKKLSNGTNKTNDKNNSPSKLICDTNQIPSKKSKKNKQPKIDLSTELAIDEADGTPSKKSKKNKQPKIDMSTELDIDEAHGTPSKKSKKKKEPKIDLSTELAIDEAFDSSENTWKEQVKKQVNVIADALSKQAKADREKGRKKTREERFDFNDLSTELAIDEADGTPSKKSKNNKQPKIDLSTELAIDEAHGTPSKKSKKKKQPKIDLSTELAIDEAFDSLENTWKEQVKKQVNVIADALSKQAKADREKGRKKTREERFDFNDRKKSRTVIDIDEAMIESRGENDGGEQSLEEITELGKQALSSVPAAKPAAAASSSHPPPEQIDPSQFLKVDKSANRMLSRQMPETLQEGALDDEEGEEEEEGEEDEKNQQQMTIEEAFADDDVVQEFRQEKESDTKKSQDVDLSLPGWGSWGGPDISKKKTKRRSRRFIIKGVKVPRKDDAKPIVILNEDTNPALKDHLVSVVPHPFTSLADYEASLRAPMGREWVPEIAHRKLTQPAIRTRLGAIIDPIDFESEVRSKVKEYR